jgi:hypothetical protein
LMVTDHGKPRQSLRRRIALSRAAAIAGDPTDPVGGLVRVAAARTIRRL